MRDAKDTIIVDMHRQFLEALRQREQDIIRFLAILGPALAGFIWLLRDKNGHGEDIFFVGTVGVILLLLIGAIYAVALGYNYRYITLQMAKIDCKMKIRSYVLAAWPRKIEDFRKVYCDPPEIIKVFWISFLVVIAGVATTGIFFTNHCLYQCILILFGLVSLAVGLLLPFHYGCKLTRLCNREEEGKKNSDENSDA